MWWRYVYGRLRGGGWSIQRIAHVSGAVAASIALWLYFLVRGE